MKFSKVSRKINNVKIDKPKVTKTVNVVEELNESISEKTGHSISGRSPAMANRSPASIK